MQAKRDFAKKMAQEELGLRRRPGQGTPVLGSILAEAGTLKAFSFPGRAWEREPGEI
jgi:hypothetical protein